MVRGGHESSPTIVLLWWVFVRRTFKYILIINSWKTFCKFFQIVRLSKFDRRRNPRANVIKGSPGCLYVCVSARFSYGWYVLGATNHRLITCTGVRTFNTEMIYAETNCPCTRNPPRICVPRKTDRNGFGPAASFFRRPIYANSRRPLVSGAQLFLC